MNNGRTNACKQSLNNEIAMTLKRRDAHFIRVLRTDNVFFYLTIRCFSPFSMVYPITFPEDFELSMKTISHSNLEFSNGNRHSSNKKENYFCANTTGLHGIRLGKNRSIWIHRERELCTEKFKCSENNLKKKQFYR